MIAAWDAKYLHRRPRPVECVPSLNPAVHHAAESLPIRVSTRLPPERLRLFSPTSFPNNARFLNDQAELAALSRLHAGVNYRSDITAGLELGRAVAALVIARARNDGSDAVFTGRFPLDRVTGKEPTRSEPLAGTWRTWVLTSGSELRPAPPPACGSEQFLKELAEVRDYPRPIPTTAASFAPTRAAYFWQGPADQTLGRHSCDQALAVQAWRESSARGACLRAVSYRRL